MFHTSIRLMFLLGGVCLLLSCDKSPTKSGNSESEPSLTPRADEEAETAAYSLSGELVAPSDLYYQIKSDLASIRADHREDVPVVDSITFLPNAVTSQLLIGFYKEFSDSIKDSVFTGWDELNEEYGLESYRVNRVSVLLRFNGRLNPRVLVDAYKDLRGVKFVSGNSYIWNFNTIYMRVDEEQRIHYYFARGGCIMPPGPCSQDFYYFRPTPQGFEYGGSYLKWKGNTIAEPAWLPDCLEAKSSFDYHSQWVHDTLILVPAKCDTLDITTPEFNWDDDKSEAGYAALLLSNEINAPPYLASRISGNMSWIRANRPDSLFVTDTVFDDSLRFDTISLKRGIVPGTIDIRFIENPLDTLSDDYCTIRLLHELLDVSLGRHSAGWYYIRRSGLVHPKRLMEIYEQIPSVESMSYKVNDPLEADWYFLQAQDTIKYFIREVSGKITFDFKFFPYEHERWHYFASTVGNVWYVGSHVRNNGNPPTWYSDALRARAKKFERFEWVR